MGVSAQQVKELRDKTGAALMDCKRALVNADGDEDKALRLLKQQGLARARKKRGRKTAEGVVEAYVHFNKKVGVLMEVACETDFVASNEEFQNLVRELCMQVASMNPQAISRGELPQQELEEEKETLREQFSDKPEEVLERIVEGKLESYYSSHCLLDQPYVRDDSKTIGELIDGKIAELGENIEVRRFVRMEVGGEQQED